jgi:hypothetical protein
MSNSHDEKKIESRMTSNRHTSAFPRRIAPESLLQSLAQGGRGECRVPNAPAALRAKNRKHASKSPRLRRDHPAFPHAMVLTAYFALSPVIGLSCHRRFADTGVSGPLGPTSPSAKLDAGVEASGPHDFAVRVSAVRPRKIFALRRIRVHRIPCPTSVTIAKRPSKGPGCERCRSDLGQKRIGIFFAPGLDNPNHLDPVRQIRRCAQGAEGKNPRCFRVNRVGVAPRAGRPETRFPRLPAAPAASSG